MNEDFLHYLWKYKKFDVNLLKTTRNKILIILSSGEHNLNSGPDFFNAQLKIDNQLWAGNVEIHLKSSDWYVHHHEIDKAYDNVILHVVWDHDSEIFRKDNSEIETLALKDFVSKSALHNYYRLFNKKQKWINCEKDLASVNDFVLSNWLERLYLERLERKSNEINELLNTTKNDWEAVLFKMLLKNFGLKVNGDSFGSLAHSLDFSMIRKERSQLIALEALLLGQAGLLEPDLEDAYFKALKDQYTYQSQKYALNNAMIIPIQFFRLRPPNFPTIRLSQMANLYYKQANLFSEIIKATSVKDMYELFEVGTSSYWEAHYSFGNASKKIKKQTTKAFIELLLINTIIPLKFSYAKHLGKPIDADILQLIIQLKSESNRIIDKFNDLSHGISENALHSQALIQLKNNYCDRNKCLQCAVGNVILSN